MTDKVEIYTDGACKGNPGPGGWGALLVYKGKELELWGGEADTTNNRMELTAAIRGLAELKKPCAVHLVTDSKYVMQGIQEWLENWKKRGWKTAAKKPVRNVDLCSCLMSRYPVMMLNGSGYAAIPVTLGMSAQTN